MVGWVCYVVRDCWLWVWVEESTLKSREMENEPNKVTEEISWLGRRCLGAAARKPVAGRWDSGVEAGVIGRR